MVDPSLTLDALRIKAHNYTKMEEEERGKSVPSLPTTHNASIDTSTRVRSLVDYIPRKEFTMRGTSQQRVNFPRGRQTNPSGPRVIDLLKG